jgi:hypothetical protein
MNGVLIIAVGGLSLTTSFYWNYLTQKALMLIHQSSWEKSKPDRAE